MAHPPTMLPPMSTPSPTQQAEAYWVRAHEQVRRGDFAGAVRDLAACFKLLQSVNDPRLPEVHRRWTEVHQMALEDQASGKPSTAAAPAPSPSIEAEAEAAANAGNLQEAIALYEKALAARPENELVSERLSELKNARPRAAELGAEPVAPAVVVEEVPSIVIADDLRSANDDSAGSDVGVAVEPMVEAPAIPTEPIADDSADDSPDQSSAVIAVEPMVEAPAIPTEPIADDSAADAAHSATDSGANDSNAVIAVEPMVEAPAIPIEPIADDSAADGAHADEFGDLSDVDTSARAGQAPAGLMMADGNLRDARGEGAADDNGNTGGGLGDNEDFAVQDDDDAHDASENSVGDDIHSRATVIPGPAAGTVDVVANDDDEMYTRSTDELRVADVRAAEAEAFRTPSPDASVAPPMHADDAPVGMQSLDVDIDMGDSVSADEADELPIAVDDVMEVDEDMQFEELPSLPPQAAADGAADGADDDSSVARPASSGDALSDDPVELLNTLLARVAANRRPANDRAA
jgi:hypothetical protein